MKYLIQAFYILLFFALGEVVSELIGHFIPGSVVGMMLLFLALRLKLVKPEKVDRVSTLLTANMGLFFVPAGVGLMTQFGLIKEFWPAIIASMVLSTAIVLTVVGWSQDRIEKHQEKKKKRKEEQHD
ncbi:CidA/LrgA family protein [Falsiporphyromonas endometrii]|uniref:CidA/LrgA family protein n=1 Tax=Falsiporphyromonas endometrii TaxID=1387297 RepID=A0ABV9K7H6_9PORP